MIRKRRIPLLLFLLLCLGDSAVAQLGLSKLTSWDGKYPTHKKGRVTTKFFSVPEIRTPLLKLLSQNDYNLLTKEYSVGTPVKKIAGYMVVKVCKPRMCFENAAFAIDLSDGTIWVRMATDESARWFASKGNEDDLPAVVKVYMEDFSLT